MYIGKRTLLKAFIVLGTIAVVVSKGKLELIVCFDSEVTGYV